MLKFHQNLNWNLFPIYSNPLSCYRVSYSDYLVGTGSVWIFITWTLIQLKIVPIIETLYQQLLLLFKLWKRATWSFMFNKIYSYRKGTQVRVDIIQKAKRYDFCMLSLTEYFWKAVLTRAYLSFDKQNKVLIKDKYKRLLICFRDAKYARDHKGFNLEFYQYNLSTIDVIVGVWVFR